MTSFILITAVIMGLSGKGIMAAAPVCSSLLPFVPHFSLLSLQVSPTLYIAGGSKDYSLGATLVTSATRGGYTHHFRNVQQGSLISQLGFIDYDEILNINMIDLKNADCSDVVTGLYSIGTNNIFDMVYRRRNQMPTDPWHCIVFGKCSQALTDFTYTYLQARVWQLASGNYQPFPVNHSIIHIDEEPTRPPLYTVSAQVLYSQSVLGGAGRPNNIELSHRKVRLCSYNLRELCLYHRGSSISTCPRGQQSFMMLPVYSIGSSNPTSVSFRTGIQSNMFIRVNAASSMTVDVGPNPGGTSESNISIRFYPRGTIASLRITSLETAVRMHCFLTINRCNSSPSVSIEDDASPNAGQNDRYRIEIV